MDNTAVGKKIHAARKNKGFTQKKLADLIGRTESSVAKYEKGLVEIPISTLNKLADVLDIHVNTLLSDVVPWDSGAECENIEKFDKRLMSAFDGLTPRERTMITSSLEGAISYNLRVGPQEEITAAIERLRAILTAFGGMTLHSFEMRFNSLTKPHDYLAFLRSYDKAIEQLTNHREELIKLTLQSLGGDDSELRELIFGKGDASEKNNP